MKASVKVNERDNTVVLRGIKFPVDMIRAVMLETGGTVVNDDEVNKALDRATREHIIKTGKEPKLLFIESIPATEFIPKRIRVHLNRYDLEGRSSKSYLYFAKPKIFHA